jgi:SAM-dependent methyltransferase
MSEIPPPSDIKVFKTNAWCDPSIANWYASRMLDDSFRVSIKHRLEGHWLRKEILGPRVIDVGIGTGRAIEGLVGTGWQLTGVDSSQAMLDVCRTKYGSAIDLRCGDATNLPFESDAFDSAVGLNLVTHFPDWKPILNEMLRVVRRDGRLIFDIYSKDHVIEAESQFGEQYVQKACGYRSLDPSKFNLYLSVDELRNYCDERGYKLEKVIPYGASLAGDLNLLVPESSIEKYLFDRLISIADSEDWFRSWIFSLECNFISKASPKYAGKFIAVITKCQSDNHWSYQSNPPNNTAESRSYNDGLREAMDCPNVSRYIKYFIRSFVASGYAEEIKKYLRATGYVGLDDFISIATSEANLMKIIQNLRELDIAGGAYKDVPWANSFEYEFVKYIVDLGSV